MSFLEPKCIQNTPALLEGAKKKGDKGRFRNMGLGLGVGLGLGGTERDLFSYPYLSPLSLHFTHTTKLHLFSTFIAPATQATQMYKICKLQCVFTFPKSCDCCYC